MLKQVIVIRADLKMGKGKIAAQAAHASYSATKKADKKVLVSWENAGQKKVVLKVNSEEALLDVEKKCKAKKILCALIMDAGRTQLEPGTVTALGIGPDKEEKIDEITGELSLLG
ncbi:MAG: peptidyl-tRNA hydrolase [Candidatus Aenigmarchaeota archaeon]|nr:peptidyl-tRNA hydrolase [Candidatus Aenigmarchaeota archaeon]